MWLVSTGEDNARGRVHNKLCHSILARRTPSASAAAAIRLSNVAKVNSIRRLRRYSIEERWMASSVRTGIGNGSSARARTTGESSSKETRSRRSLVASPWDRVSPFPLTVVQVSYSISLLDVTGCAQRDTTGFRSSASRNANTTDESR